jgi:ATP-dependent exoDNAse (exonuclease V) beta subunit
MVFSPTALEDFRHCPRKYFFKGVLGLDEGLFASLLGSGTLQKRQVRGALSPLERGNLAHLLLQRLDFSAAPDEQRRNSLEVARLATVGGKEEELATVIDDVLRAAHLLAPKLLGKELFREHPFTLSLQGEATYLIAGAMDLLAVDDETALVYDYKYLQRQGANLSGYQFQLRSYLLTLARAFPDRKHWGALLFLRGGELEEVTLDEDPFALQLVTIMDSIRRRSSEEDFDLRHDCDGSNCPFRQRCGR